MMDLRVHREGKFLKRVEQKLQLMRPGLNGNLDQRPLARRQRDRGRILNLTKSHRTAAFSNFFYRGCK